MKLVHEETTGLIIGAAIDVHRALGPGYLESAYERALVLELHAKGIPFAHQPKVPLFYRGVEIGFCRPDLMIDGKVVVELKTVSEIVETHRAIKLESRRVVLEANT